MDFNSTHKEEVRMGNRLAFGVHKVQIVGFTLDETDAGKEYIEVAFVTADGVEDSARVWFSTDQAAKFSFNNFKDILLHNVKEEDRPKAAAAIDAVPNTAKLAELLSTKLIGKEMWATKYIDPNRTYEKNGQRFQSVNVNVYGYEPKQKSELMPRKNDAAHAAEVFGTAETPATDDAPPFTGSGAKEEDWV